MWSPGVPSPGMGQRMVTSQGDPTTGNDPFHEESPGGGWGLHWSPRPLCHDDLYQHSLDKALIPWGKSCPFCFPHLCWGEVGSLGKTAHPSRDMGPVTKAV